MDNRGAFQMVSMELPMTLQEILDRLNRSDVVVERLLEECRSPDKTIWEMHPELYTSFTQKLIEQGHPGRALELAREGERYLKDNSRLQYQLALAAVRGGSTQYAESLLEPLLKKVTDPNPEAEIPTDIDTKLRMDIIALKGRILKDCTRRDPTRAKESAEWYEKAAGLPGVAAMPDGGTFPMINAATMWRIAGYEAKSSELANEVLNRIASRGIIPSTSDMWLSATMGEANMLLGHTEESTKWYKAAVDMAVAQGRLGDLASLRNNYHLLMDTVKGAEALFLDEYLGSVIVFSGHMVDSPERIEKGYPHRFPNSEPLIVAVKSAIVKQLETLNAKVGYCSLGCGGDILFAEAMIERQAELHIVLPFAQHDFFRTSVDYGQDSKAWRKWRRRFDDVLEAIDKLPASNVQLATSEPYLGSEGLYAFTNQMIQGLAVMRARERVSAPKALILIDRTMSGQAGGAESFEQSWRDACHESVEIDLGPLRIQHAPIVPRLSEKIAAPAPMGSLQRPVKAMLFADVAGFSKISEWDLSRFLLEYSNYLRMLFASDIGLQAKYANSWGDGLYVVFDDASDATAFAMELVDPTFGKQPKWSEYDLGTTNPFRVGLHAGPVFELPNLFRERSEFAGQHVNRAARIEPVTVRGCAYASEPFAALLTMRCQKQFAAEAVGVHSLDKQYDRVALYRVRRSN